MLVAFLNDLRVALVLRNGSILLCDIYSVTLIRTLKFDTFDDISAVAFSPASTLAQALWHYPYTVKASDMDSGKCIQVFDGYPDRVYRLAFSKDASRLASVSFSPRMVKIWDVNSGGCP